MCKYDHRSAKSVPTPVIPCGHISCWHGNSWWAQVSHVADPVTCQGWHDPWKSETKDMWPFLLSGMSVPFLHLSPGKSIYSWLFHWQHLMTFTSAFICRRTNLNKNLMHIPVWLWSLMSSGNIHLVDAYIQDVLFGTLGTPSASLTVIPFKHLNGRWSHF